MPVITAYLPEDGMSAVRAGLNPFPPGAVNLANKSLASNKLRVKLPMLLSLIENLRQLDLDGVGCCTTQVTVAEQRL